MPKLGRLDHNGVLVAVEDCSDEDHKTCPHGRTVAMEDGHDMGNRLNGYRWDFNHGCFLPKSVELLDQAERNSPELLEALILTLEAIVAAFNVPVPHRAQKALKRYRDRNPARPHPADGDPA